MVIVVGDMCTLQTPSLRLATGKQNLPVVVVPSCQELAMAIILTEVVELNHQPEYNVASMIPFLFGMQGGGFQSRGPLFLAPATTQILTIHRGTQIKIPNFQKAEYFRFIFVDTL